MRDYTEVAAGNIKLVDGFLHRTCPGLARNAEHYEEARGQCYVEYLLAVRDWLRSNKTAALSTYVYLRLRHRLPRILGAVYNPMGWLSKHLKRRSLAHPRVRTGKSPAPGLAAERRELLLWGLGHLSQRQNRVLRLVYGLDGEAEHEIKACAAILGCHPSHVRYLVNTGRKRLGTFLQRRLDEEE